MRLSKRLETVASFVQEGSNIADIGTDHGYIPIALVMNGITESAIAMDVRSGPLERARRHIKQYHLEDKIETRLSDGVDRLEAGEADTVIIAGMGGELILHIMEEGRRLWKEVKQWIISPQSELDKVRSYLKEHGFCIAAEAMVEEDGKYYTVMDVRPGEMGDMSQAELHYGTCLIKENNQVLKKYLEKEWNQMKKIEEQLQSQDSPGARERAVQMKEAMLRIKEAQDAMR